MEAESPVYQIPSRNSRSILSTLLHVLRALAAPVVRRLIFLIVLLWATAFIPLVVTSYALYVALVGILVALPQALYSRLTGRRVEWVERALPFGRTLKMSPDELKKRNLGDSN